LPRIRSIKPEFWKSDQVNQCSLPARLMFIGLWNFCDDEGRAKASATLIKREIFPDDPAEMVDAVKAMLQELSRVGLIELYFADGQEYLHVTGFARHQKIDKRWASKLPAPPGHAPAAMAGLSAGKAPPVPAPAPDPSPVLADSPQLSPTLAPGMESEVESEGERNPPPAPARATRTHEGGRDDGRLEADCRALLDGLPIAVDVNFSPILRLLDGPEIRREDVLAAIAAARAKDFRPRSWGALESWVRRAAKDRIEAALGPRLTLVGGEARAGPNGRPAETIDFRMAAARKMYAEAKAREEAIDASSG
jgi:hypothetical protein